MGHRLQQYLKGNVLQISNGNGILPSTLVYSPGSGTLRSPSFLAAREVTPLLPFRRRTPRRRPWLLVRLHRMRLFRFGLTDLGTTIRTEIPLLSICMGQPRTRQVPQRPRDRRSTHGTRTPRALPFCLTLMTRLTYGVFG